MTPIFYKLRQNTALSLRYSREVWGSDGRGKERSVTIGIGLCGGVVQMVRTPACHAGGRGFECRRSRQHSLTIAPQVRALQRMRRRFGARRIGKLVVQASIVQGGGLRRHRALARQTEPRLCVVAVELS